MSSSDRELEVLSDVIDSAVESVRAGRLIVIPTDTVYGIATRADSPEATARLFEAKGRSRDAELPVFVGSRAGAHELVSFDERAEILATAFWPGALTLVLPRVEASAGWDLGGDGKSIGVRIPRHTLTRAIVERTGPLAISSANKSGEETPATCDSLRQVFGEAVDIYICDDRPLPGVASTVVDSSEPLRIIRQGGVSVEDIMHALPPELRA